LRQFERNLCLEFAYLRPIGQWFLPQDCDKNFFKILNLLVNKILGLIYIGLAPVCPFEEILAVHLERVAHFGRVTRCYSVTSLSTLAYLSLNLCIFQGHFSLFFQANLCRSFPGPLETLAKTSQNIVIITASFIVIGGFAHCLQRSLLRQQILTHWGKRIINYLYSTAVQYIYYTIILLVFSTVLEI
jgi:hypothetical protein